MSLAPIVSRLTASIDGNGQRIEYTHDIAGQVEVVKNRRGHTTTYVYDDNGWVRSETNALGEQIVREYDANGSERSTLDPEQRLTTRTFDARGNLLTETNNAGETVTRTYGYYNQLKTEHDAYGRQTLFNEYWFNPLLGQETGVLIVPGEWKGFDYAAMADKLAGEMDPAPRVLTSGDLPEGDPSTLPPAPAHPDGEEPVRWIYSTSGTTSDPKGVQHTDGTLLAGGRGLADALQMTQDDVGSIAFPFAHIAGPDYLVMMLLAGMSAVIVEAFMPGDAVEFYKRSGVTMASRAMRKNPASVVRRTARVM